MGAWVVAGADGPAVNGTPQATNDFALVQGGVAATIVYDTADAKVVQIASGLLAGDIERVTGVQAIATNSLAAAGSQIVLVGRIGACSNLDALISTGKLDVSAIRGGWERYQIQVVDKPFPGVSRALVIAGSDRRGTAYGVFSLSEAMGVSPWYWWADVPPQTKSELYVSATPFVSHEPSVRYRGIFINDEDWGLQPWAAKNFESGLGDVKDIGPKTYAKVFELLLRLKANFIWPAMHPCTAAFNAYPSNKFVADNYAIVMGSSHAEPMLRNNVYEWSRFVDPVTGQSYSDSQFNYEINRNGVYRYWEQRAISNGRFENVYTLGKRGIHDSGMVEGSNNTEKANWLNIIIGDQRQILTNHVNPIITDVPQIFVPYKEVLGIYDTGLVHLPDDVSLVWPDDNYGYIRRLSDPTEEQRSGGGGVYYHISYWGSPADYLWLCSTPPALMWEELTKAYAYNCHRLWVINVGDIKPGEIDLEFAMRLAWDVNRYHGDPQTEYLADWAKEQFGASHASQIAELLNEYYRLGYARKPEQMNWLDTDPNSPSGPYPLFSFVHYGGEAAKRLAAYSNLVQRAQAIDNALPANERSAFFETVLYPILGADGMNRKFLDAGRAYVASVQGRNTVAADRAASQQGYDDIQSNTATYNSLEGGKWNDIMSSKPRGLAVFNQAALPSVPTLGAPALGVALEGRLEPALLSSNGVVFKTVPGFVSLNAASDGVVTAPMVVTNIGGLQALSAPDTGTNANFAAGAGGKAVYRFNVATSGSYTLSFEINCPTVDDDSWFIQVDNGAATRWNNLANGGVWAWATFGSVHLAAGAHTLTVYEREDGTAMAAIKLTSAGIVLVEDRTTDAFQLPEFNRYTRRSHFIDLFNTGTNSVKWQIAPADPWVHVSQTAGSLASETRLWVSIDWSTAPHSDALSSILTISSAGQSLAVPIRAWNPATQLPLAADFVEDNHAVAIEAEHYSKQRPGTDASWVAVPELGSGDGAMMVSPVTAPSRTSLSEITNTSPVLEYGVYLRSTGTVSVVTHWIPTLPINQVRRLRYAVSFDGQTPQIVDMSRNSGSGSQWSRSVLRAGIDYTTRHPIAAAGLHELKIWMVDPGVVLDRLGIATGELPYTYHGPPETAVANFGSVTISNAETYVLPDGKSWSCDSLFNDGTLALSSGAVMVGADATNNGTLRLAGNASFDVGGQFVNNGLLDIMTWQGTLPSDFVNHGTVLDRSAVRIESVSTTDRDLDLLIHGYEGHGYQLQGAVDGRLSGSWTDLGEAVPGSNSPISFAVTNAFSGAQGFYRVRVFP